MIRERPPGRFARGKTQRFRAAYLFRPLLNFIETDSCFQHQQYVEALLAQIANHPCDVLGFRDGLVNRFPELLDQVLYLFIQTNPRFRAVRGVSSTYFESPPVRNSARHFPNIRRGQPWRNELPRSGPRARYTLV